MSTSVRLKTNDKINFVACSLKLSKIIDEIEITSNRKKVFLTVSSEPEIFYGYKEIAFLNSCENDGLNRVTLTSLPLVFNGDCFRDEDEDGLDAEITVRVYESDSTEKADAEVKARVSVQPFMQWDSLCRESLPAFMQPNDRSVIKIRKRAAEIAAEKGISMCGYQTDSLSERISQAGCIFEALKENEIYSSVSGNYDGRYYTLTLPQDILSEKSDFAGSFDLAVLYASCIEEYFNPVIFIKDGYAFSGFWLEDEVHNEDITAAFEETKEHTIDSDVLREIMDNDENGFDTAYTERIVPVATDLISADYPGCTFKDAVSEVSHSKLSNEKYYPLNSGDYCVDVSYARQIGVSPLFSYTDTPLCDLVDDIATTQLAVTFSPINYVACHLGTNRMISKMKIISNKKALIMHIKATPEIFYETRIEIKLNKRKLKNSYIYNFNKNNSVDITLNDDLYRREFTEAKDVSVTVELFDVENPNVPVAMQTAAVRVQPYLHWDILKYRSSLIAFTQPNDLRVVAVRKRAAEIAAERGISMCGYQDSSLHNRIMQARCVFEALKEKNLHYSNPPVGFENVGQPIRVPQMYLNDDCNTGTCVDNAVLFASCIEEYFEPCIFIIPGHAFSGFWIKPNKDILMPVTELASNVNSHVCPSDAFAALYEKDCETVLDYQKYFIPVECNMFTTDFSDAGFDDAVLRGIKHFPIPFLSTLLNVKAGREKGIHPVFCYNPEPVCGIEPTKPVFSMLPDKHNNSKLELLQQDSMDFTMGNPLINAASADILDLGNIAADFADGKISDAGLNDCIYGEVSKIKDGEKLLNSYFVNSRYYKASLGADITLLALGKITWNAGGNGDHPATSPLYLCPVSVFRNAGSKIAFAPLRENIQLNTVLKEKLYRDYNVDLSSLPADDISDFKSVAEKLTEIIPQSLKADISTDSAFIMQAVMPNEAIYRALKDEKLLNHDIVNGILNNRMSWDNEIPDAVSVLSDEIFAYPADSSQRKVIDKARSKRSQLIYGPPGTGKSQTIANLIVDAIIHGKKILFTADKKNARDVIYEKLKNINLSEFCFNTDCVLNADDIKNKVDFTVDESISFRPQTVNTAKYEADYIESIKILCAYSEFIRNKYDDTDIIPACGETKGEEPDILAGYLKSERDLKTGEADALYELAVRGIRLAGASENRALPHDEELCEILTDEDFVTALKQNGSTVAEKRRLASAIMFKLGCEIDPDTDAKLLDRVAKYCELLSCVEITHLRFDTPEIVALKAKRKEQFAIQFSSEPDSPIAEKAEREIKELGDKLTVLYSEFDGIEDMRIYKPLAESPNLFNVSGFSADESKDENAAKRFKAFANDISSALSGYPSREVKALIKHCYLITAGGDTALVDMVNRYKQFVEAEDSERIEKFVDKYSAVSKKPVALNSEFVNEVLSGEYAKPNSAEYARLFSKCSEAGLGDFCNAIEAVVTKNSNISPAVIKSALESRCNKESKINSNVFDGVTEDFFKAVSNKFKNADKELRKAYVKKARNTLFASMPDFANGVSNDGSFGKLFAATRKKANYKRMLNTIFTDASEAMLKLFPCVIMSPEEVACIFTSNDVPFDTVIMDEASQLPSYKALVAISKANSCIIVGDDKQLVPTTFFKKNSVDSDGSVAPIRTAFDEGQDTSMPKSKLRFHYRSKFENLIAFSNIKYYNNNIYTFPSVNADKGITSVFCENAVYERGKSRTNPVEAQRVIELINDRLDSDDGFASKSVGIIAVNIEQSKLLASLIAEYSQKCKKFGAFADYIDVVNLESCQGREWDITYLSTVYGHDETGKFVCNLGPITQSGGGNRLNVMLTRAKEEMIIVTSLKSTDFGAEAHGGNGDFKDLLALAEGDQSVLNSQHNSVEKGSEKLSAVIKAVKSDLTEAGFTVDYGVGSSRFKIELAVKKPGSNSYSLGIIFDDIERRMFIRDFEFIIPEAMMDKGWQIYRLHTEAYLNSKEKVIEEIKSLIN